MSELCISKSAPKGSWIYAALAGWATVVVASLGWLAAYSFAPGGLASPPRLADVALPISPSDSTYQLVMAVHPKCPCSRASMSELARLLPQFGEHLQCTVLAYRPADEHDSWIDTDLVRSAREQPHTNVVLDVDGNYARQLGMSTSGSVVLYSPEGAAEYWGGITTSRGHCGDNIGSDAIRAILSGEQPARRTAKVFGCQIRDWASEERREP